MERNANIIILRKRKIRNYKSNKPIYRRRNCWKRFFFIKAKAGFEIKKQLNYMKKREMGWQVLFYNIRRNIVFDGKNLEKI